jgi:alkanesulfonate monooxygenase SsuD/methylene tetrahydromethanopterin reductase-like flavin-dependent oxidoreductase (luciferase family)
VILPGLGILLPTSSEPGSRPDVARLIAAAQHAEECGYDSAWVGDHMVHPRPLLESIVTLAALTQRTKCIEIGTNVLLMALRQPLVIAKQLASLSYLAGPDRLSVGIGVGGEHPTEWEACGVDLSGRGGRTEEILGQVQAYLRGTHLRFRIDPPPVSRIPFFFAGRSEIAIRRAARLGDGWMGIFQSPSGVARATSLIKATQAAEGREGGPFSIGMMLPTYVSTSSDARSEAVDLVQRYFNSERRVDSRLVLAGDARSIASRLEDYRAAGCDRITLLPICRDGELDHQLDILFDELPGLLRA